jgi:hypothetical protein
MKTSDLGYFQQLLERIQAFVGEIETIEQSHSAAQCVTYAPGRCPGCSRIRQVEQGQIERTIDIFDDELSRLFSGAQEPDTEFILEMTAMMAKADVFRCHARGHWPRSVVEMQEVEMIIWPLIKRRLELDRLPRERQGQLLPLFKQVIAAYQRSYHEVCLHRWPLRLFEHYNSPLQLGDLPAYYR